MPTGAEGETDAFSRFAACDSSATTRAGLLGGPALKVKFDFVPPLASRLWGRNRGVCADVRSALATDDDDMEKCDSRAPTTPALVGECGSHDRRAGAQRNASGKSSCRRDGCKRPDHQQ
jgi:hypothetical protein